MLKSYIPEIVAKLKANEQTALDELGAFIKGKMDSYVAVDTGNLKNHNYYKVEGKTLRYGNKCPYGVHLEFGTRKMRSHPFITPATNRHKSEIEALMSRGLKNGLG